MSDKPPVRASDTAGVPMRRPGLPPRLIARILGRFAAVFVGVVAGFFVAFNSVFSDIGGSTERVGVAVYVLVSYAVFGAVAGLIGPTTGWRWSWWLWAPAAVMLVAYTFNEYSGVLWHALVLALAWAGSAAGAAAGAGIRHALVSRAGRAESG